MLAALLGLLGRAELVRFEGGRADGAPLYASLFTVHAGGVVGLAVRQRARPAQELRVRCVQSRARGGRRRRTRAPAHRWQARMADPSTPPVPTPARLAPN